MELNRRRLITLGAAALAGCTAPTSDAGDPESATTEMTTETTSAQTKPTATATPAQAPPTPSVAWDNRVGGQYAINTPAIAGELVVFQSDSDIYALTRENGKPAWSTDLESYPNYYFPVHQDGRVFAAGVGSTKEGATGTISAIDATSGDFLWREHNNVAASPVADETAVYFSEAPSHNPSLVRALSTESGEELWRFEITDGTNNDIRYGPTLDGDQLIAVATYQPESGGLAGVIYCLDKATGEPLWRQAIDTTIGTRAIAGAGGVCIGTSNGGVIHLFERTTGEKRWTYERLTGSSNFWAKPAVTEDAVFAGNIGSVVALASDTGTKQWEIRNNRLSKNGIIVTEGTVYTAGRSLFALAPEDGTIEWSFEKLGKASAAFSPPAIADGRAFVGSCLKERSTDVYDHVIYGLELPGTRN